METIMSGEGSQSWLVGLAGSGIGLAVAAWIGIGPFIQVLLVLMLADIISGMLAAIVTGGMSSDRSRRGMAKKAMELLLVLVVGYMSEHLGSDAGFSLPAGKAVAGFFCATELVSILENAVRAGINIGPLKAVLEITRKTIDRSGEDSPKPPRQPQ